MGLFSLSYKRAHRVVMGVILLGGMAIGERAHAQYVGQISSVVVNARTGKVLSAENPDLLRYPASLTKVMTLYMAFQALRDGRIHPNDRIHVSYHAAKQAPSKLGLRAGGTLTVRQAILALVTKSANDAACALGEHLAHGSEERFARMMTHRAHMMGMYATTFRNASGLPNSEQLTTARDLSVLSRHIVSDFPEYYHYFSVDSFVYRRHRIRNHNPMLNLYSGADGLKTGYTGAAGHNLITSAYRHGTRLVGVVLGAPTNEERTAEMVSLLDAGFVKSGQSTMPLLIQARYHGPSRRHRRRRPIHGRIGRTRVVLATYRQRRAAAARRRRAGVHRVLINHRYAPLHVPTRRRGHVLVRQGQHRSIVHRRATVHRRPVAHRRVVRRHP